MLDTNNSPSKAIAAFSTTIEALDLDGEINDSGRRVTSSIEKPLLGIVLLLFGALTLVATVADGLPGGVFDAITFNWVSLQIYVDLVIAVAVICVWIYRDATKHGRNPWPWLVAAAIVGMFSPLVYLLTRDDSAQEKETVPDGSI